MNSSANLLDELRRNGHVLDPKAQLVPLSGGVSSEIYLVEDGARKFVVKRALPKLRVRDDWYADVSRNRTEQDYMAYVDTILPGAVPQLYFSNPDQGYFGMEYLGSGFLNWRDLLITGDLQAKHAKLAGIVLSTIHRTTGRDGGLRKRFDTTTNFHQLRVDPYLLTTGERHPELQGLFVAEAQRIEATREALVHGDFSPKNMLFREARLVLLDSEVAWFGDPTFDVAFLLVHLFLDSLYHVSRYAEFQTMIDSFWQAYQQRVSPEDADRLESRLVPLVLMLLLARVDGKSPVGHLLPSKQSFIRAFARKYLIEPPTHLAAFCAVWFSDLNSLTFIKVDA